MAVNNDLQESMFEILVDTGIMNQENMEITDDEIREGLTKKWLSKSDSNNERKKKKRIMHGPDPPPDMPDGLKSRVFNELGGTELLLIYQKKLFMTDLNLNEGRFSIPENQLEPTEFLRELEKEETKRRNLKGRVIGLPMTIVEPSGRTETSVLKRWPVNNSYSYALTKNWNKIVVDNDLQLDQVVQLWFFRNPHHHPCFALVRLDQEHNRDQNQDQDQEHDHDHGHNQN